MAATSQVLDRLRSSAAARDWRARLVVAALCVGAGLVAGVAAGLSFWAGLGAVLALPLALAILVNAQVGLIAFVAVAYLLPFAVIPVPIGGVKLTFVDATLTALLAVWVLRLLTQRDERPVATPLDVLVIVFLGLAIASFIIGVYSVTGEIARFFLKTVNSILFFFSVTNVVRQRRHLELVGLAVIGGGLAAAALGLVFWLLPADTATRILGGLRVLGYPSGAGVLRYIASTSTLRATGTAVDPNVLGGMLVLALPFTLSQVFGARPLLPRRLLAPAALAMIGALILTYSRGSWIGVASAALFLAVLKYRRLWVVFIAFAVALYFLPAGDVVLDRLGSGIQVQDQAAAMRMGEYKDALRLISQYPWFGVGFGDAPDIDLYIASSSVYLMMAEEMGLIGLAAFLVTMGLLLVYALRGMGRIADLRMQTLQVGALAALWGALTAGLFDHYFFNLHFPHTVALFWLFVGLTMRATQLGIADEETPLPAPFI